MQKNKYDLIEASLEVEALFSADEVLFFPFLDPEAWPDLDEAPERQILMLCK